jgi:electron transport complex protein RnfD
MTPAVGIEVAPGLPKQRSVRQIMALVLLALVPGIAAQAWQFGYGILFQIALAVGFGIAIEAAMLRLRSRPLRPFLSDLSAPVAAVIFALCLPPLAPWWIAVAGIAVAMILAKHLQGGLGSNRFNPAMAGYAVVLVFFPDELARGWPLGGSADNLPGLGDTVRSIFAADSSTAPLLETNAPGIPLADRSSTWVVLAYLCGGVFLWWKRVIRWQVPTAIVATTILVTLPLSMIDPATHLAPLHHLLGGSLMLAAFFIATDPVTGCITARGRLVFGAGVALLVLAIRYEGTTPDAVPFAILLMNCAAPWIDLRTRRRVANPGPMR